MIKKIFSASVLSGIGLVLQCIMMFVFSDAYDLESSSNIIYIFSFCVFFSQVALIGFPQVSTRIIATANTDKYCITDTLLSLLIVLSIVVVGGLVFFQEYWFSIIVSYLYLIKFLMKRVSMGLRNISSTVFFEDVFWVAPTIISIIYIENLVFVKAICIVFLILSLVIHSTINYANGLRYTFRFDFSIIREYLKPSLYVMLFLIGRLIINRIDIIYVEVNFNDLDFSAYSLAHRFSYIITFIPLFLSSYFSGYVSNWNSNGEFNKIKLFRRKYNIGIFVISLILCVSSVVVIDIFLEDFAVGEFVGHKDIFFNLILSQLFFSMIGLNQMIVMMQGNEKKVSIFSFCVSIFIITILYLFKIDYYTVPYLVCFYAIIMSVVCYSESRIKV